MDSLVLYHSAFSPSALKVRFVLEERGLAWEGRLLDLMAKQNLQPEYLAINPRGLVPTLVVGGRAVIESAVICEFLEDYVDAEVGAPSLRPSDPFACARMRVWMKVADEDLHWATGPIPFATLGRLQWLGLSEAQREELLAATPDRARAAAQRSLFERGLEAPEIDVALATWARTLSELEAALTEHEWLAGAAISLADFSVAAHVYMLDYMQLNWAFEAHPRLRRWYERVKQRPAFARSLDPYLPAPVLDFIAAQAAAVGPGLSERLAAASLAAQPRG
ncbi:Glutathione S-transferase family protein [Enhygromyxa salina]|uniref:Glutathione S-transferase family protein n=1 Tax=Enhygromyxa salina TaxID=215803 RepID=A0A0C2CW24_9BACT|nr:glutathione S-transferase family protein [Enhygromyxa salina]KIG15236.1 Glutathione S-transferase family protein [Enhygromyxa salina]